MSNEQKVRIYLGISLDGYIAGPDNDLSWLPTEVSAEGRSTNAVEYEDIMAMTGALLMGRTTHDVVAAFDIPWPYKVPVLVATHRVLEPQESSVVSASGTIDELIARAREIAGENDVYLDGGNLCRQGLAAGLVDEIILTYIPQVLGAGTGLFEGLEGMVLEDVRWEPYGDGCIQMIAKPRLA